MNKYDPSKHSKSHQDTQCSLPQVRRTRGANTFSLRNQSPTLESLIRPMQPGFPSDPQQPGGDSSTPLRDKNPSIHDIFPKSILKIIKH